jgi:hypothetical protein
MAAEITGAGWHPAPGRCSAGAVAAAAGASGHSAGSMRWRVLSETADSSADERACSGGGGAGERGFASALLPGKFWKKRKSKSRRKMLQVGCTAAVENVLHASAVLGPVPCSKMLLACRTVQSAMQQLLQRLLFTCTTVQQLQLQTTSHPWVLVGVTIGHAHRMHEHCSLPGSAGASGQLHCSQQGPQCR